MSELDAALEHLRGHAGVEGLVLLGRDGLVVRQLGAGPNSEGLAARVPGLAAAADALGDAAGRGSLTTAVLEFREGVAIVVALSGDLLLSVLVQPGIGFAPLLRDLGRERERLAQLV